MRIVWVIFGKEFIDTVRDRRTMAMMLLVPLILVPVIVMLVTQLQARLVISAKAPLLRVGVVESGNADEFMRVIRAQPDMMVVNPLPPVGLGMLMRRDSIDAAFVVAADFDPASRQIKPGQIDMVIDSDVGAELNRRRLREVVTIYRDQMLAERLADAGLDSSWVAPVQVGERETRRRFLLIGQLFGGILPYFFIIFCYLGAMYPAIDLAAGEKERATMETLLTSPASRMQIVLGKFGVVVLCGLASALMAVVGLYVGVSLLRNVPFELLDSLREVLHPARVALVSLLLIPLSMCFAGLMLTFSIFARSFKEAQSILSPFAIITVLPAVVGLLPGVELTTGTALFPMLNISVAMREIIAGNIDPYGLFLVFLSLTALAAVSLYFCTLYFRREEVIFRS